MKTEEIRNAFLSFFESKGHSTVSSSSLIPAGDPTLLFTNAGMVQFKDTFLGTEKRPYLRATTCQKCLRISGKHNDLENVGRTARHHTFFEMLGNFSFGDYFKTEAIEYAWEFVTVTLGLPKERLWVTVFDDDDEAAELWRSKTTVQPERILRYGENDNFWAMGDTGPCGPCSEIFYYLGDNVSGQSEAEFRKDDGTYIEIWNLVFMQYNRNPQGNLEPLPKPSVDTGMGLERVAAVKQGFSANYDSDGLRQIIAATEKLCGKTYLGKDYTIRSEHRDRQYAEDIAFRVIADHVRAVSFLIADGVMPSTGGRGYVLRRLLRRACRHGRNLDFSQPFLYKVASTVVELMSSTYPELSSSAETIKKIVRSEEEKFLSTLDAGMALLEKEVSQVKERSSKIFPGRTAFLLHDTYGFPLDMTDDIARGHELKVDHEAFSAAMVEQQERSRSARASESAQILQRAVMPIKTTFCGYDYQEYESQVAAIYGTAGELTTAGAGTEIAIVTEQTPFYGESGGQLGDSGTISSNNCSIEVLDTQKIGAETIVHICRVVEGEAKAGMLVRLSIDGARRARLRANHSATHLLHQALREILGEHIKQAGSRVSDRSLRFDFNHFEQISAVQIEEIEARVNQLIRENQPVETQVLGLEEAQQSGAIALFGEKYGETVRVVQIGSGSREFCGGTHAARSGDLGLLSIASEGAISAGVRRIEAYAGSGALSELFQQRERNIKIAEMLNCGADVLEQRVEKLIERQKDSEREIERFRQQQNLSRAGKLSEQVKVLADGTKVVTGVLQGATPKELREAADDLRARLGSGCIALASVVDGKVSILAAVTDDLVTRFHAGNLVKEISTIIGGSGGGRADMAQAGGGDPAKINQALTRFEELLG